MHFKDEYGTQPVRFLDASNVTMYDAKGKKIENPKCEKCGCFKNQVIGKTASCWICQNCNER